MAAIDKVKFAEFAWDQANYCGVNSHYISAVAQYRSQITNDVADTGVGPFRFSQVAWDENRKNEEFGFEIPSDEITDWRFQCLLFAAMTHDVLEQCVKEAGRMPTVVELYVAQLKAAGQPEPTGQDLITLQEALDRALKETAPAILQTEAMLVKDFDAAAAPEPSPELVLFRRLPKLVAVRGHLVVPVQKALIQRGYLTAVNAQGNPNDDGVFGPDTEAAVSHYQTQNQHTPTGALTVGQWRDLTRQPPPDVYDLSAQVTAAFEGTDFGGVNETDIDDTVLTFGYHGYTLKGGSFLDLLRKIEKEYPNLLAQCFTQVQANALKSLLTVAHDTAIASGRALFRNGKKLTPGWKQAFAAFGATPQCRRAQLDFSREVYWKKAESIRNALKVGAPLSRALCFDVAIQNGDRSKLAGTVADSLPPSAEEVKRRDEFVTALVATYDKAKFQEDVRTRKKTFIDGVGKVHGGNYDLANWGFADPESSEADDTTVGPHPAANNSTFEVWFGQQFPGGITAFSAHEFLVKGGLHAVNKKNSDPPKMLWPNIIPTVRVLLELKQRLGNPQITLNSVYRSRAYNESVGGARNSQHMKFTAVDFVAHDGRGPSSWAKELYKMRSEGRFKGGIGVYRSFVHVDTRGYNADWA